MKNTRALLSGLFLAGSLALGISSVQAEGVILRDRFPDSKCCHMRFPESHENTLGWGRPSFNDASSAGVFDPYRPCDYDPVNCCAYFCDDVALSHECGEHRPRDLR